MQSIQIYIRGEAEAIAISNQELIPIIWNLKTQAWAKRGIGKVEIIIKPHQLQNKLPLRIFEYLLLYNSFVKPAQESPSESFEPQIDRSKPQTKNNLVLGALNRGSKTFENIQKNTGLDNEELDTILEDLD